jgi:hypothetical protein
MKNVTGKGIRNEVIFLAQNADKNGQPCWQNLNGSDAV